MASCADLAFDCLEDERVVHILVVIAAVAEAGTASVEDVRLVAALVVVLEDEEQLARVQNIAALAAA